MVITKWEFDELKSLVDDLQCFLESLEPKTPLEDTFAVNQEPQLTPEELSLIF